MSIDKKKWQDIAEKYDTKAKWADALLMLNTDDHDDIISALIELDPQDLIPEEPWIVDRNPVINTTWVSTLDTTKVTGAREGNALEKAEEALQKSEEALESLDAVTADIAALDTKLEAVEAKSKVSLADVILNLDTDKLPDPQEIIKLINRDLRRGPGTK